MRGLSGDENRILVAGAGIGGLNVAFALKRAGFQVTVFEKAPRVQALGAGVGLWVDGMMALTKVGLDDVVAEVGAPYGIVQFRNGAGTVLAELPVGELANRHGARAPVMVRRPELLRVLSEAVGADSIQTASECIGFDQDREGVSLRLSEGREERGAVLIVADGLDSTLREGIAGEPTRRYAGYQYLRLLTQAGEDYVPRNTFSMTVGRGDRVGLSHAGGGWRYLFGVLVVPQGTPGHPEGPKADLQQRFGDFPEPIPRLIEETGEDGIFRTDTFDIKPLERWGEGRVTMLGDAAHAMTPNMGRGAGESIQDAVALAQELAGADSLEDHDSVSAALRRYERARKPATDRVHTASWRSGKLMSVKPPPLRFLRDQLMAHVISKEMIRGLERELKGAAGAGGAPQ